MTCFQRINNNNIFVFRDYKNEQKKVYKNPFPLLIFKNNCID